MSYNKIKRTLQKFEGVKITKKDNRLIMTRYDKLLINYDLKFVDYSKQNTNNFIEYWSCRLKEMK